LEQSILLVGGGNQDRVAQRHRQLLVSAVLLGARLFLIIGVRRDNLVHERASHGLARRGRWPRMAVTASALSLPLFFPRRDEALRCRHREVSFTDWPSRDSCNFLWAGQPTSSPSPRTAFRRPAPALRCSDAAFLRGRARRDTSLPPFFFYAGNQLSFFPQIRHDGLPGFGLRFVSDDHFRLWSPSSSESGTFPLFIRTLRKPLCPGAVLFSRIEASCSV